MRQPFVKDSSNRLFYVVFPMSRRMRNYNYSFVEYNRRSERRTSKFIRNVEGDWIIHLEYLDIFDHRRACDLWAGNITRALQKQKLVNYKKKICRLGRSFFFPLFPLHFPGFFWILTVVLFPDVLVKELVFFSRLQLIDHPRMENVVFQGLSSTVLLSSKNRLSIGFFFSYINIKKYSSLAFDLKSLCYNI